MSTLFPLWVFVFLQHEACCKHIVIYMQWTHCDCCGGAFTMSLCRVRVVLQILRCCWARSCLTPHDDAASRWRPRTESCADLLVTLWCTICRTPGRKCDAHVQTQTVESLKGKQLYHLVGWHETILTGFGRDDFRTMTQSKLKQMRFYSH